MDRRRFLTACAATPVLADKSLANCFGNIVNSKQEKVLGADELVTKKTEQVIKTGLAFLAKQQVKSGKFAGAFGQSGYQCGVAVSALAGLAFMCSGSTPFAGRYARQIRACTKYILKNVKGSGYISNSSETRTSNMYGHGYAMLYLTQAYGMSASQELKDKLKKAIAMTCKIQNKDGGWRYQPVKADADLSITICQIMALRAAHNAGLQVSNEVREKTIRYVERSQNSDGSFKYTLRGGRTTVALTAAGVVSYYSAGIYEGEKIDKALKWIMDRGPGKGSAQVVSPMNYYYAHYYAVQAMWHAQLQHPEYWNRWYPAIRDELLTDKMNSKKLFPDDRVGTEFGTAMACIILQIPFNYLPIFAP